jgi:hypothetical protein
MPASHYHCNFMLYTFLTILFVYGFGSISSASYLSLELSDIFGAGVGKGFQSVQHMP